MTKLVSILISIILCILLLPTVAFGKDLSLLNANSQLEALNVKSSVFNAGNTIPIKYTCTKIYGGKNISIPVEWSGAPSATKSFALLMYDLAPVAKNFVHWAVLNIPCNVTELKEGASNTLDMPAETIELINTSGTKGYAGPCPPIGTGKHEYKIIVYALNENNLNFSTGTSLAEFQLLIKDKVLAQGELSGYFQQ